MNCALEHPNYSMGSMLVCVLLVGHFTTDVFGHSGRHLVGGFTPACPPSSGHRTLLTPALQSHISTLVGTKPSNFEIISVSSQVVAGTNYKVVVKLNDTTCYQLTLFQGLYTDPTLMRVSDSMSVQCPELPLHCSSS
ncbi:unnamed protein product [Dicrocoelium dendriticum]|nr:unnamed protein product [Dicrocoelium dendriticum]